MAVVQEGAVFPQADQNEDTGVTTIPLAWARGTGIFQGMWAILGRYTMIVNRCRRYQWLWDQLGSVTAFKIVSTSLPLFFHA